MTLAEFWSQCLHRLHNNLTVQQFNTWVAPLTVGEENGLWVVYGKNQFVVNMLKSSFADVIEAVRSELVPEKPALLYKTGKGHIDVTVIQSTKNCPSEPAVLSEKKPLAVTAKNITQKNMSAADIVAERIRHLPPEHEWQVQVSKQSQPGNKAKNKTIQQHSHAKDKTHYNQTNLSPDYTFNNLVEGKGNRLAAAAAQSIAEHRSRGYNPFFLYGSTGLGKTHLVQAIGNGLLKNKPDAKVRYMHSDDYVRSLMNAARNNAFETFKQQYRQYDLLIIDDVQFIKGKERTMEEFFHLYNYFYDNKKQLILTCDVLPTQIENMDDRLKSRFSWGLTLELEPPELEMRVAILQKKAEAANIGLSEDAAFFIANLIRSNVRELEGAFNRVSASSRFSNKPIDIDLARQALQDIVASSHKVITTDLIIESTARYYRIKISDILSKKRTRNIVRPRQMAMSLTKELTNLSLPDIGDAFGGRDHTTVMHGVKAIAGLRESDPEWAQDYEKLLIIIQN